MDEKQDDPLFPPGHTEREAAGGAPQPSGTAPAEAPPVEQPDPSPSAPAARESASDLASGIERLEKTMVTGFSTVLQGFEAMIRRLDAATASAGGPPTQGAPRQTGQPNQPQPGPSPQTVSPPQARSEQPAAPHIQAASPSQRAQANQGGGLGGVTNWLRDKVGGQGGPPAAAPAAAAPAQPAADNRWQNILFGPDFANNQGLMRLRQAALAGLLAGQREATSLVGTLLIFQAADGERMPQLLKDVGEAYYRFHGGGAGGEDPMRDALVSWLHRKCETQGVSNTIVLVRPGDRFDANRHHSKQKGVEVSQVHGWVVLRDNGKVYTKATVEVR